MIRKVFLYGSDIDVKIHTNLYLKNELITSRFKIDNMIQIYIHCAISSYLSKIPLILPWYNFPYGDSESNESGAFNIKKQKNNSNDILYFFILDTPSL